MVNENIWDAREELKRVDHLIFVSLKYTRTCDVMRSIIERLISTYDNIFLALLNRLKKEKVIDQIPNLPATKVDAIKKHYSDKEYIMKAIDFYMMLRRFNLCKEYTRIQEFRRNVTMILDIDKPYEITIDIVTEYYKDTRDFLENIRDEYFKSGQPEDF